MWWGRRADGRDTKRERREPTFSGSGPSDIRPTQEDRVSGGKRARGAETPKRARGAETSKPAGAGKARARRRSRSLVARFAYWAIVLCIWGGLGAGAAIVYYAAQLPPIDQLAVPKRPPNIAIMGEDGTLLANRGDTGGPAIRLSELPPYLPKAFIAIEDRRFYSHLGIDPLGILRALVRNVTGRGAMQGGSTLTQQLAKNLFLTQERTLPRKIQEAILALWLEHRYSKDQILELYLNRVYFGSGAYGVEAAAQKYFGHGARDATLSEAAILAGLMKAPTKLAPNHNPEAATERAAQVITAMAQEGHITEAMAKIALARPAGAVPTRVGSLNYAADYVMDTLNDTIGAIDQDLVVSTTLSGTLQTSAEQALTDELDKKGGKYGVTQGAIVALDPGGAVRALVGGRNYADSQFDRAVSAHRQPGSAFKPFVYLTALEKGLTPDTVRDDAPINVKGWQPENYSHEYFGPVTLTNALALSLNTVAVRVGMEAGPRNVVKTAHRLGITSDLQPNASIALGTSEVTPLELVAAYAPFANGGIGVQPYVITKVRTAGGKVLYQRRAPSLGRVIEPQYVAMMNAMMQETLLTGTAKKAELPGWQAAGKTGTSQDFRDAWFIGYTSHMATGVWLGNDDNSPTKKTSGGNLPVEIWSRFMKEAHRNVPPAALPGGTWRPVERPDLPLLSNLFGGGQQAAPRDPAGAPVYAAQSAQPMQPSQRPVAARAPAPVQRDADAFLPPADIPSAPSSRPVRSRGEQNFFEKLFGG
jgi:penicillin-binding protein 1A